jgi:hypothetical protein
MRHLRRFGPDASEAYKNRASIARPNTPEFTRAEAAKLAKLGADEVSGATAVFRETEPFEFHIHCAKMADGSFEVSLEAPDQRWADRMWVFDRYTAKDGGREPRTTGWAMELSGGSARCTVDSFEEMVDKVELAIHEIDLDWQFSQKPWAAAGKRDLPGKKGWTWPWQRKGPEKF